MRSVRYDGHRAWSALGEGQRTREDGDLGKAAKQEVAHARKRQQRIAALRREERAHQHSLPNPPTNPLKKAKQISSN
jgi:hypothetical protein